MSRDLEYFVRLPYAVTVATEATTDGETVWIAAHPELDGCMAHGESDAEAASNLEDARRLYLATMLEDGLTPPVPTSVAGVYAPMRAVLSFLSGRERVSTPPLGIFQSV